MSVEISDGLTVSAPVESIRNRVLRRADWRFLLASPEPERSIVSADAGLREAVRAISNSVVELGRETADRDCELAVAQNPDRDTLDTMWRSLRPGGACYTEWTSRFGPGAAGIQRRLEAAGFEFDSCYSPRPSFENASPEVWLPLSRRARQWHVSHAHKNNAPEPTGRRIVRDIRWRAVHWAPVSVPICAVARKPARDDRSAQGVDFQRELRHAVIQWDPECASERSPWVLVTHGAHSSNKIVLLGLSRRGAVEYVIKLPRVATATEGIRREAAALSQVRQFCGDVPGVPRLLSSGLCAGIATVAESPLNGIPLSRIVRDLDYLTVALKATRWQTRLIHTPRSCWGTTDQFIAPLISFAEQLVSPLVGVRLIEITKAIVRNTGRLPIACEQRDFSPWNILLTPDEELAVLDWESAEPHGLPGLDLIYFLTYLAASQDGPATPDRVRHVHRLTLDPSTRIGTVTEKSLHEYMDCVGIAPANLRALRLICWMVHARSSYDRTAADVGIARARELLRENVFVQLWEQEARAAAGQVSS